MTYAETLAYLYAQLPMFQRIGQAAYKADLKNTHALMDALDHPERGLRCVHVAGTNGKGSTCSMLASILQEAGYKVGLHTSPHLKDFRERFRINGQMVSEEVVTRFVEEHRSSFEPIAPSFFEWGVAFALCWFREEQVEIAVMETGMGGRLDSTNVITPDVSVITNIGRDHMQFLGDTLPAIAREKAGIIKTGIPVVVGEADEEVEAVFRQVAAIQNAPFALVDQSNELPYPTPLAGRHQEKNLRTVLATVEELRKKGWKIGDDAVAFGLENVVRNTGLRGRWEQIGTAPLTLADVAHNEDGVVALLEMIEHTPHDRLHMVLGMVNDKDIGRVLSLMPKSASYYFCKADIPRGLDAALLCAQASVHGLIGTHYASVSLAMEAAKQAASSKDLVLVTGSVFVVAEVV